jgi:hypothetical protein
MRSGTTRFVTMVCAGALLASCEAGHPTAPTIANVDAASAAADKAPSVLTATAVSETRIDLGWQDNSPNEAGFEVYRSTTGQTGTFALLGSTAANVTAYVDQGLTAGMQYCYQVRSFRRTGAKVSYSAFSPVNCARTPAPPAAASNLSAAPSGSYAVALAWADNSSTETGFRLERAASVAGPWEIVTFANPNVTSFYDWGRPSELLVCYRVFAYNGDGSAPSSNVDCTAPPNAPSGLSATTADPHSIDLAWTDNSAVEDGFEVQRSTDGVTFTPVANVPANAKSYRDGGLASDVTYTYFIRATRDGGFSNSSNSASAFTVGSAPGAPTGVNATPFYSNGVWMTWDYSPAADSFHVQRAPDATGPWTTVAKTEGTYYSEDGLVTDQRVCYRVIAINDFGDSDPSSADCTAPPAAPVNLAAQTVDYQSIQLTWDAGPAVKDGYTVRDGFTVLRYDYWCDLGWNCDYGYAPVAWLPADATSFVDTGLASEYWYSYYVYATNDGGGSDWSNEANAMTDVYPAGNSITSQTKPRPSASALRAALARAMTTTKSAQLSASKAAAARAAAARAAKDAAKRAAVKKQATR